MTTQENLNLGSGVEEALQGIYDKMLLIAEHGYHPYHTSFNASLTGGFVRDTFEQFSARNNMFLRIYTKYLEKVENLEGKVSPVFLTISQGLKAGGQYTNEFGVPIEPNILRGCPVFSPLSFEVEDDKLSVIQKFRLKTKGFKSITPTMLANARAKGEPESINGLSYNAVLNKVFKIIPGKFRQYLVYNACEFSGLPNNMTYVPPTNISPFNDVHKKLLKMAVDNDVSTNIFTGGGPKGKYNFITNTLHLRDPVDFGISENGNDNSDTHKSLTDTAKAEYLKTNFHELIHSTGYFLKDNRFITESRKGYKAYSIEEVVAESGAVMMASAFGVKEIPLDMSANYIMSYLKSANSPTTALWEISTVSSKVIATLNNNNKHLGSLLRKSPPVAKALIWNARSTTKNPEAAFAKIENMAGLGKDKQAGLIALSYAAKNLAKNGDKTPKKNINILNGRVTDLIEQRIKSSLVESIKFLEVEIPKVKKDIEAEFSTSVELIPAVPSSGMALS
ncbi:MAG: zincin-like metallopeptidase domain-containing protein [Pseudomonadota bacterium]